MNMRSKANWSLIILACAFITILVMRPYVGESFLLNALLFIVEAGMVGALADWFAVTALFRHPLGLKFIPHTAIIPRNKNKLIEGVVKLVEEQLLDRELIAQKLDKVAIVKTLIEQIGSRPINKLDPIMLKRAVVKIVTSFITAKNVEKLETSIESYILTANVSNWLSSVLKLMEKNKWDDKLISRLLEILYQRLSEQDVRHSIKLLLQQSTSDVTETSFFKRLLFKAAEAINAVNIDDAADIIYQDILQLIEAMNDDNHPVRQLIKQHLTYLTEDLRENENINAVLRIWIINLIAELKLKTWMPTWLLQFFQFGDEQQSTKTVDMLTRLVQRGLQAIWTSLIANEIAQQRVESYIKNFLSYLIQYEYKIVGEVVETTLAAFTDERLVEFIESKVETDLQRIRLNGALVGAFIGAIIYLFLFGVYAPLLSMF